MRTAFTTFATGYATKDRCRAHVRHTPRNLARLSNAAISIVRFEGRFQYMPPANRYYAARAQDAIDAIPKPLKRF